MQSQQDTKYHRIHFFVLHLETFFVEVTTSDDVRNFPLDRLSSPKNILAPILRLILYTSKVLRVLATSLRVA